MDLVLTAFIIGISFGFILFLVGTGLSLTMGLMKIVNLSHGAIYMVGAYAGATAGIATQNFIIGIIAGTFSSVCIAPSLLVVWDKGEWGRFIPRTTTSRARA